MAYPHIGGKQAHYVNVRSSREPDLDELAGLAIATQDGDRAALGSLSRAMQQPVYRLALRFCGHPIDAEDVALEVMLRLLTSLETYDGRSRFTMWVYTNAVRQLLRTEPRPAEIAAETDDATPPGSLLCLSREQRLAYILSDLIGFTVVEGAEICAMDRVGFQAELMAARSTLRTQSGRAPRRSRMPISAPTRPRRCGSAWSPRCRHISAPAEHSVRRCWSPVEIYVYSTCLVPLVT
jgi:DNA-directed RNA polymerase specialized sigma24 family protein